MLERIFAGVFDAGQTQRLSVGGFLICMGAAIVLGLIIALCYAVRSKYTKSFLLTVAMLPSVVCVVIMMVNGNIGAGVAVAGAFSLVRFRSAPGSAKEIVTIFLSMGTGLICGMGYIGYAAVFAVASCAIFVLYNLLGFGADRRQENRRTLKITIPEDLNYPAVMDGVLDKYTAEHKLVRVKTKNMGSMFSLTYDVTVRDSALEKEFIDMLRMRNGNLEISLSRPEPTDGEL